jgi:hypothetical protein
MLEHRQPKVITVYFQRYNKDGSIDLFLEFKTEDAGKAEIYCDVHNHNLAMAGVPSCVACYYTV